METENLREGFQSLPNARILSPPLVASRAANLSPSLSANKRKSLLQPDHVKQKTLAAAGGRLESTGV